jgi:3,4-dihydroxy 2-butanone 4-phosphate synthase / GTP cyclohydrolase II
MGNRQEERMAYPFMNVEDAIQDIKLGKMLIVVDDEDRENEGDLVMAADRVRPEDINFMASRAKGLLCQAISGVIA